MCRAKDMLGGTPDLLRLLDRTNHIQFKCWDLVWIPRLEVNLSHVCDFALEMAPDHASGDALTGWYFGFAPTSGPDNSHTNKSLGIGAGTAVSG